MRTVYNTNGHFNVVVDTTGGIADLFIERLSVVSRAWTWCDIYRLVHEINQAARQIRKYNDAPEAA